jgi:ubiquinone/menaquinone biosynthesis C-methylase UbiE
MAQELSYRAEVAAGYDLAFGSISAQFIPALLRGARVLPGYKVLDVATGTGLAADAAINAVGPYGAVVATDLSPAMLEKGAWASPRKAERLFRRRGRPVAHLSR